MLTEPAVGITLGLLIAAGIFAIAIVAGRGQDLAGSVSHRCDTGQLPSDSLTCQKANAVNQGPLPVPSFTPRPPVTSVVISRVPYPSYITEPALPPSTIREPAPPPVTVYTTPPPPPRTTPPHEPPGSSSPPPPPTTTKTTDDPGGLLGF